MHMWTLWQTVVLLLVQVGDFKGVMRKCDELQRVPNDYERSKKRKSEKRDKVKRITGNHRNTNHYEIRHYRLDVIKVGHIKSIV